MPKAKQLPPRSKVKPADTWDLASLFKSDDEWEAAFAKWEKQIPQYEKFRGELNKSPASLAKCLRFDSQFSRAGERLGTYAFSRRLRIRPTAPINGCRVDINMRPAKPPKLPASSGRRFWTSRPRG